MSFPVVTTIQTLAELTAIKDEIYKAAPNAAKARLFKNDVNPDANMTPATFEEADFSGYAAVDMVMSVASLNDSGLASIRSNLLSFESDDLPTQTVYGVYITNAPGDIVYYAQRFDEPQIMGGPLVQACAGVWRQTQPFSSLGWIDVEN